MVRGHPIYKKADAYVNFDDKFALVQKHSLDLFYFVGDKVEPVVKKVFFLYDSVMQRITAFIQVALDKQEQIVTYVNNTYSYVTVQAQACWLRLDFDKDESVTVEDLKKSMFALYEFLKDYSVLNEMSRIKCQLYSQAIEYMKAELSDKKKQKKKGNSKLNAKPASNGEIEAPSNEKKELNGKHKKNGVKTLNGNQQAIDKSKK